MKGAKRHNLQTLTKNSLTAPKVKIKLTWKSKKLDHSFGKILLGRLGIIPSLSKFSFIGEASKPQIEYHEVSHKLKIQYLA